jgi:hypothetical protein
MRAGPTGARWGTIEQTWSGQAASSVHDETRNEQIGRGNCHLTQESFISGLPFSLRS